MCFSLLVLLTLGICPLKAGVNGERGPASRVPYAEWLRLLVFFCHLGSSTDFTSTCILESMIQKYVPLVTSASCFQVCLKN